MALSQKDVPMLKGKIDFINYLYYIGIDIMSRLFIKKPLSQR
jgi:hypothetical protein